MHTASFEGGITIRSHATIDTRRLTVRHRLLAHRTRTAEQLQVSDSHQTRQEPERRTYSQAVRPENGWYLPLTHATHAVEPFCAEYEPAALPTIQHHTGTA
jgi:hypothetical protein